MRNILIEKMRYARDIEQRKEHLSLERLYTKKDNFSKSLNYIQGQLTEKTQSSDIIKIG
jgi:hypothetical protein